LSVGKTPPVSTPGRHIIGQQARENPDDDGHRFKSCRPDSDGNAERIDLLRRMMDLLEREIR
jgi:hypothetical protein